jgi:hypothetical protein
MISPQCSCGYVPDDADDLADHLRDIFIPDDAIGADGCVHDEIAPDCVRDVGNLPPRQRVPLLACFCGFAADETLKFDDHILAMFLTPDRVGIDGNKHVTVIPA